MAVPQPRRPRCYRHHTWHADCDLCREQREAERAEAEKRPRQAAE